MRSLLGGEGRSGEGGGGGSGRGPAQGTTAGPSALSQASACTSENIGIAREKRRIGRLPSRTEARRLSTFGLRIKAEMAFGYAAASQKGASAAHQRARELGLGVGVESASACRGRRGAHPGRQSRERGVRGARP